MKWQPIETAPKDGQDVLLCRMNDGICLAMGVGSFGVCRPQYDGYQAGSGKPVWRDRAQEKLFPSPTHWMPLPEPPPK